MITVTATCPICDKPVKPETYERGWTIGCVGDRHCVQLYRGASADEVVKAWEKLFSKPVGKSSTG